MEKAARDVRIADVLVHGSRSTGFFADVDGHRSCSMMKFADAD